MSKQLTENQQDTLEYLVGNELPELDDCIFSTFVQLNETNFFNTIVGDNKKIKGVVTVHAYTEIENCITDFKIVNVTGTGFHADQAIFEGYDYDYADQFL